MPSLDKAISLLQTAGLRPDKEMYRDLEGERLEAILLYWSSITRQAGWTKINETIGDGYDIHYFPNNSHFRITVKK